MTATGDWRLRNTIRAVRNPALKIQRSALDYAIHARARRNVRFRPIADTGGLTDDRRMWPNSKAEWQLSIGGWLAAMFVLAMWGIFPAAIFGMVGAGALMVRRYFVQRR